MKLNEATERFINAWGTLGASWGINKTMAQIHAQLLVAPEPLTTEDIMGNLSISRGNANMNIRALIDWKLVYREVKLGERKEFFSAEKDMWTVAKRIITERRKRELEPIMKMLSEVQNIEGDKNDKDHKSFNTAIKDLENFAAKADRVLESAVKADENWFTNKLAKLMV